MSKAQTVSTTASDPTVAAAAAQFLSPVVLGLEALTVVKNRLEAGMEIDEAELAAIQSESEGGRAFERAPLTFSY